LITWCARTSIPIRVAPSTSPLRIWRTGSARSYRAIQRLPDRWRLWHPFDPSRLEAAEASDQVGPNTVVWLNEAQHYLLTPDPRLGEHISSGLRTLLTTPSGDQCS
jgi:hypothetical protein